MSITMVQCSIHKVKNKKANRLVTRIHKISPLSPNWSSNIHDLQHLPLTKDWTLDFQPRSNWGLSHGADYFSLTIRDIKKASVFRSTHR